MTKVNILDKLTRVIHSKIHLGPENKIKVANMCNHFKGCVVTNSPTTTVLEFIKHFFQRN